MYDLIGTVIGVALLAALFAPVALAIYLWISSEQ